MSPRRAAFAVVACVLAAVPSAAAQVSGPAAVRMNQAGFEISGPKAATVASAAAAPLPWRVVDTAGTTVARGVTTVFGADAASGETVHQIDFSTLTRAGEGYRLEVANQTSRPFGIAARPFARLKYDAMAYFYQNRAGVPISADHVSRPDLARPAGHAREVATCFSGVDQRGTAWPGCDYSLDVTGGWYDAGDHGKYVVNGGISVWTLVNAAERARSAGRGAFDDGRLDIPEAGNGVDDLLDEARYEIDFLLRMQIPDGATARVPDGRLAPAGEPLRLIEIDAGGMAHHKVHDRSWTSLPTAPADAPAERLLYPPSTAATLNLAAVAAQCARVWREADPAFSATCLTAARRAWAAARRHPAVFASSAFDGGGGYGDGQVADEFYWAAAELFAATGEAGYLEALKASPHWLGGPRSGASATGDPAWPATAALGTITLAVVPTALDPADRDTARRRLVEAARAYLVEGRAQGYGLPRGGTRFEWGSNGALMNRAMILGLAHDFTGEAAFRDGVIHALDFLLGRNPLDRSFVSGWGARPMVNPHHRFWAHSADPAWPAPPAGALSGGPNNTAMTDDVARTMAGHCAPLTCWADDLRAYALNEVAINWNAPLVWVAAFIDPAPLDDQAAGAAGSAGRAQ
ncbi:glycoside hydrolase family 9 protein [Brevundimonas sp.]|uniref:glycoside hydrolase family 9 protein n=1 Tax=Brevundimonas sp. TaxID=1871086 RepID=UPI002FCC4E49